MTCQDRDEIDGLGDQRAGHSDDGLLDELFEAANRADGAAVYVVGNRRLWRSAGVFAQLDIGLDRQRADD